MMAKSGVKFHGAYYAFGEFDIVILGEAPDNKSMAAALIAAADGGAFSRVQTTVLRSLAEGLEAPERSPTRHRDKVAPENGKE